MARPQNLWYHTLYQGVGIQYLFTYIYTHIYMQMHHGVIASWCHFLQIAACPEMSRF